MIKFEIKSFLIFFLFCLVKIGNAQQIDSLFAPNGFIFKINLPALFDGEIRLLMEKHIKSKKSIELTASYYTDYSYFEFERRFGFKTGVGLRYYLGKNFFYLNPSFFYKYVYYENATWATIEGAGWIGGLFDGSGSNGTLHSKGKHVASFQLQLGGWPLLEKNRRLTMELYGGAGGRLKYIDKYITLRPSVHMGLLIGYKK